MKVKVSCLKQGHAWLQPTFTSSDCTFLPVTGPQYSVSHLYIMNQFISTARVVVVDVETKDSRNELASSLPTVSPLTQHGELQ